MRAADPFSIYGESPFDVVSALSRKRAGEIRVIDEADPPSVAEPEWETPQVLECEKTASDFAPRVAMNAAGQGMAIWCRREGGRVRLWTRICTQSEGWGEAEPMNTDDAIGIGFPQIAMDARGHAIVAWRRFVDPVSGIWVNRYVPNLGWTGATLLQQEIDDEVFDPRIAMNDRGDAVVVWQQSTATHNTVWASRHVAGAGWERPAQASQDGVSDASAPRVAMDASGNAMVVWRQFDGVSTSIWANLYDISRGWGVADVLDVEQGGTAFDAQIEMSPSGNAIAIWTQTSREHSHIYAGHYLVGRGWGRTTRVGANGDKAALLPQLAMDARGNAMAVWCQRDGKRFHVYASRYQAGAAWSLPLRIDAAAVSGAGDSCDPQLAMDAEGAAIVVWHQLNGVQRGIWVSHYQLGADWSRAHELKTPGGGDAFEPQIVMNKDGSALALWQAWTDSHFSVLASLYR